METTMFALGVLAMIMVILVTVVVVGIVKVFKMNKQITNLYSYTNDSDRHLNLRCHEIERSSDERLVRMEEHFHRAITSQIEQSNSYTDKRIDKLIDTYFMVKEAEETNKKLIKG